MKTFTYEDVDLARDTVAEISGRMAQIHASDHPLEREQQIDLLRVYITPRPGRTLLNLAQELADERILSEIRDFIGANRSRFYRDELSARKAAEGCDSVSELISARRALDESPSPSVAAQILEIFSEFLASPAAAIEVPNGSISNGETRQADSAPAEDEGTRAQPITPEP